MPEGCGGAGGGAEVLEGCGAAVTGRPQLWRSAGLLQAHTGGPRAAGDGSTPRPRDRKLWVVGEGWKMSKGGLEGRCVVWSGSCCSRGRMGEESWGVPVGVPQCLSS